MSGSNEAYTPKLKVCRQEISSGYSSVGKEYRVANMARKLPLFFSSMCIYIPIETLDNATKINGMQAE